MLGFRGHFGPLQYMPNKPTKWGVQCFTMADSSNGYVLNVLVYTGNDTLDGVAYPTFPQPARIVLHLTTPYLGESHHVYTDRYYYTSIPLVQTLHPQNTAFTGTINQNRADLPDEFRSGCRLARGEFVAYRHDHLMALAWRAEKEKKPVLMLYTCASAATATIRLQNPYSAPTKKPVVVDTYNHKMNGADIADQHTVYYSLIRKTVKWWQKIFLCLMETSVVNSDVLYHESTPSPNSHIHYRRNHFLLLMCRKLLCVHHQADLCNVSDQRYIGQNVSTTLTPAI